MREEERGGEREERMREEEEERERERLRTDGEGGGADADAAADTWHHASLSPQCCTVHAQQEAAPHEESCGALSWKT